MVNRGEDEVGVYVNVVAFSTINTMVEQKLTPYLRESENHTR